MKKGCIYIALAFAVVLSGCSTGFELTDVRDKALNSENGNPPEQKAQRADQGKIPKDEQSKQGDSQLGQPDESTSPNGREPESGELKQGTPADDSPKPARQPKQLPVQPSPKVGEPTEPKAPEKQNVSTPEVTKPNDAGMPVETGDFQLPIVPELKINPNFLAPEKFQHPLQTSDNLTFMLGQDDKGNYLYSEGAITDGAYKKFKRYVAHYEKSGIRLDRLMMHSPGGLLAEGIQIGQYLRDNNWTTDLDTHMRCYSSCAMIYAAGVEKRMQGGAEVGFHRPYIPGEPDTPELINQVYQDYQPYWDSVEGDPSLYDNFMKNYGREDMLVLTTETALQHMRIEKY